MNLNDEILPYQQPVSLPSIVVDARGTRITAADLPKPEHIKRWSVRWKQFFVDAVAGGLISREEFTRRYGISEQVFSRWAALRPHGREALRATHLPARSAAAPMLPADDAGEPVDAFEGMVGTTRLYVDPNPKKCLLNIVDRYIPVRSAKHCKILAFLAHHQGEVTSKERLFRMLYGSRHDIQSVKIVDVFLCNIRKLLEGHELSIGTVWGAGHFLEERKKNAEKRAA